MAPKLNKQTAGKRVANRSQSFPGECSMADRMRGSTTSQFARFNIHFKNRVVLPNRVANWDDMEILGIKSF